MTSSQDLTLLSRSNRKSRLPLFLGCVVILGLVIVALIFGGFFYSSVNASGQSIITIRSPQQAEILIAGEPVQVQAIARNDDKVTRIELWVNDVLLDVEESNTQNGINPFPLLTTWYPEAGAHTLIVRAFDQRGRPFQATIYVTAVPLADRDGDGIADDADACPDQPGTSPADGCPDRDFDGITDATDACPDEAGLPPNGCPAPDENDRDGDGMLDHADACPDQTGSPLADGCPDADGDGMPDHTDACPAEPGAGVDGCPEPEGTLPPDPIPGGEEPPPEPRPGDEPPVPSDDEEPEEGSGPPLPPDPDDYIQLEIEAYSLYVREVYDNLWCYVRLGDEDPRRYDFAPEEGDFPEQMWNIAAEFSGENSVTILHHANEPLTLSLNCFGSNEGEEPVEITALSATHLPDEWDGRQQSLSPAEENTISVRYHICSPSCSDTVLEIPRLAPVTLGPTGNGPYTLRWQWGGDESQISGFLVRRRVGYSDENIWVFDPSARSLDLADYMPACGETVEFYVVVFRSMDGESFFSPPSNREFWHADPCTYTAAVTFTRLEVHNPPADEDGLRHPGPIYGNFWISNGTTVEYLEFNACWCYSGPGATFWGWCEGLELQQGNFSIYRGIFDWIHTARVSCLGDGCNSNDFYAPFSSTLHIPFEDGGDLTVGGLIMDCDSRNNANDVLFEAQDDIRINVDDLAYLTEVMELGVLDEHVNLHSFIRLGR